MTKVFYSDKYIFDQVAKFERVGIESTQATSIVAELFELTIEQVMFACDRWINEGQFDNG